MIQTTPVWRATPGLAPWRPAQRRPAGALRLAQSTAPQATYSDQILNRLLGFGMGSLGGLVLSAAFNLILRPRIGMGKRFALTEAAIMATIGAASIALPIQGRLMDSVAFVSGVITGSSLADAALITTRS